MKKVGMIFSTDMVKALLAGRKTVTRRMSGLKGVNEYPNDWDFTGWNGDNYELAIFWNKRTSEVVEAKPRALPGDLIYARETWQDTRSFQGEDGGFVYKASENGMDWQENDEHWTWRPAIHMPKAAARIWLECTGVKCERLQDITEEEAIAEGVEFIKYDGRYYRNYLLKTHENIEFETAKDSFASLIDSINGEGTWDRNPWIFCYSFCVLSTTGKP